MISKKRLIDILLALFLSALLFPLMLLVWVLIKVIDKHPPIFSQMRTGYLGSSFVIYKFRSMLPENDVSMTSFSDSQCLTKLGKFLRNSSLDELPQLLNVIKGDMSMIGPRPLLVEYLPLYSDVQKKRHLVRPGITGWAQICGRNSLSWEEKFELDVWYVENQSICLDIKILFLTIKKILLRENISQSKEVTMEKFKGTRS